MYCCEQFRIIISSFEHLIRVIAITLFDFCVHNQSISNLTPEYFCNIRMKEEEKQCYSVCFLYHFKRNKFCFWSINFDSLKEKKFSTLGLILHSSIKFWSELNFIKKKKLFSKLISIFLLKSIYLNEIVNNLFIWDDLKWSDTIAKFENDITKKVRCNIAFQWSESIFLSILWLID